MKRALIAMSGGVDSSVAALLMKEKGYECIGATMHLYDNDEIGVDAKTCCSADDVGDARSVAANLGMPHYVFNFSDDFRVNVIDRFVYAYEHGITPNPCIDCNRYMKFERFYRRAMELGCDYVVTGHYVRVERDTATGRYLLKKGLDESKDQSYVLYSLTQEQLSHALFPLGELTKPEVRAIAERNGLINAGKHESQDICFVSDGDYAGFIRGYTGKNYLPGDFVDETGKVVGRHKGVISYTIGQRRGLGIASERPYYVSGIDVEANTVELSRHEHMFSVGLTADHINIITSESIGTPMRVKAKIRYRHAEQPAVVTQTGDDEIKVIFDEPQRAITRGQAVVLYDGDTVVGGGTINSVVD